MAHVTVATPRQKPEHHTERFCESICRGKPMRPRRIDTHRKGYSPHAFTPAEDARILELRAARYNFVVVFA